MDMTDLRTLLDDALEVLVVPSFTSLGASVRERLFAWEPPETWSLAGKTVVITGPTSGLGREAAGSLARMGARLVLVGRDRAKLERTAAELAVTTPDVATAIVVADLSSLASVRTAAATILATEPTIDVLIDNAGAMFAERAETAEGFEGTFATMVLGPFVLLAHLWPRLSASPDGRVVAVTSGGMYTQRAAPRRPRVQRQHLRWPARLRPGEARPGGPRPRVGAAAGRARTASSTRCTRAGPTRRASRPRCPGFRRLLGGLLRTPAQGVDTILWLAAAPDARATTGRVYLDRRVRPFDRVPATRVSAADRRTLWDVAVRLSGDPDPFNKTPRQAFGAGAATPTRRSA